MARRGGGGNACRTGQKKDGKKGRTHSRKAGHKGECRMDRELGDVRRRGRRLKVMAEVLKIGNAGSRRMMLERGKEFLSG